MVTKKKARALQEKSFDDGVLVGKVLGERFAYLTMISILKEQKEAHGNLAGIDDMIALLSPPNSENANNV